MIVDGSARSVQGGPSGALAASPRREQSTCARWLNSPCHRCLERRPPQGRSRDGKETDLERRGRDRASDVQGHGGRPCTRKRRDVEIEIEIEIVQSLLDALREELLDGLMDGLLNLEIDHETVDWTWFWRSAC
jgi:hypothetical protein